MRAADLDKIHDFYVGVLGFDVVFEARDVPGWGTTGDVLFLSADNFQTSEHFDATYGGWGWQAWGGVSVPLSGNSRITAEVFRNQSEVGRDVDDPQTGVTYREIVNLDGVGMRFGLGWGF